MKVFVCQLKRLPEDVARWGMGIPIAFLEAKVLSRVFVELDQSLDKQLFVFSWSCQGRISKHGPVDNDSPNLLVRLE